MKREVKMVKSVILCGLIGTWRAEGKVSDLKKMMKSWRESWSKDSKVASQAVILMFIPIILGLWLNKRDACLEKIFEEKIERTHFEANQGDRESKASEPPPPSPLLSHPLALQAVQLGSRYENQQKGQTELSRSGILFNFCSPSPKVVGLPNLTVFAITGYGQESDSKPNLEKVMKKYTEGIMFNIISRLRQCPSNWEEH